MCVSTAAGTVVLIVGFCEYMRDFIVETWERHRLWGITYQSSDKYFTSPLRSFCAFIGLCDRVRFFANTYFPGSRFLPYLLVYYWSGLLSD